MNHPTRIQRSSQNRTPASRLAPVIYLLAFICGLTSARPAAADSGAWFELATGACDAPTFTSQVTAGETVLVVAGNLLAGTPFNYIVSPYGSTSRPSWWTIDEMAYVDANGNICVEAFQTATDDYGSFLVTVHGLDASQRQYNPPSKLVTVLPAPAPTDTPTEVPTDAPTALPTDAPTAQPTNTPDPTATPLPTSTPTALPTNTPTALPTEPPTNTPLPSPTLSATDLPDEEPASAPTEEPPSAAPTEAPLEAVEPVASPTPVSTEPTTIGANRASLNAAQLPTATLPPTIEPTATLTAASDSATQSNQSAGPSQTPTQTPEVTALPPPTSTPTTAQAASEASGFIPVTGDAGQKMALAYPFLITLITAAGFMWLVLRTRI